MIDRALPEIIAYKAVKQRFACGDNYTNIMVVNFTGPGGSKACAYACSMNLDADGEPQAYGPQFNIKIKPKDGLKDAGWLPAAENTVKKAKYDAAKKIYDDLVQKKLDLAAKAKSAPGPTPVQPAPKTTAPPATTGLPLDAQIATAEKAMHAASLFWNKEPKAKQPKNLGTIFWRWYGVTALTDDEYNKSSFHELVGGKSVLRRPDRDTAAMYEDVDGAFPVKQSSYEPGPGYFVSPLAKLINTRFPKWDQRAYLPVGLSTQIPYAALTGPLAHATGLKLKDTVLAVRLDNGQSLAFPFLDAGNDFKVAECSIGAFAGLGGVLAPQINRSNNDFVVLYLAFVGSANQTTQDSLDKFASAANAEDFPFMLAFIAQATLSARKGSKSSSGIKIGGDPISDFEVWKTSASTTVPGPFDVVRNALNEAGFRPEARRLLKRHPSLIGGSGPYLTDPGTS